MKLKGKIGSSRDIFFVQSTLLWDTSSNRSGSRKLGGRHEWPFSFTFPLEYEPSPKVKKALALPDRTVLPQSLSSYVSIYYSLIVKVKRSGILRADSSYVSSSKKKELSFASVLPTQTIQVGRQDCVYAFGETRTPITVPSNGVPER